jgi:leader peptidase (prepilin peptidase)/N-methyltransferase
MSDTYLAALLLAIVGLFIGSFLGTLVLRLPDGKSVVAGRSSCPHCGRRLAPFEMIPVLSWSIQAGRCRGCRGAISRFYPAMEIGAAIVPLWAGLTMGGTELLLSCVLGWMLFALAVMDLRVFRLSDRLTIPLLAAGIAAAAIADWQHVFDRALGAVLGFLSFYLLARLYRRFRGQEGLGAGDAKLLGAGGAWIAWQGLAPAVLIASCSALIAVLGLKAFGQEVTATTRIPFGALLALGIWIVWLYVPPVV